MVDTTPPRRNAYGIAERVQKHWIVTSGMHGNLNHNISYKLLLTIETSFFPELISRLTVGVCEFIELCDMLLEKDE